MKNISIHGISRRMGLLFLATIIVVSITEINAQQSIPYRWENVVILGGGFVTGIVFSPAAKDIIYARTDVGGAYRWNQLTNNWIPITDEFNRDSSSFQGIESIAPDPIDSNVVYAAVGMYESAGNGLILRSTNRGDTWTKYNIAVPMGSNGDGRCAGERLTVDPNLTSTLYFGSRSKGLWRSTNSGKTWSKVTSFTVAGNSGYGLNFVIFDKSTGTPGKNTPNIYVGVNATTAGSNLYISQDTGKTWSLVQGGPTKQMPPHAALSTDSTLYLIYNNGPGPSNAGGGAVWKYHIPDGVWTKITPPVAGGGFGGISVDASNPETIIICTIDWWAPDQIYRSTNGGLNWKAIGYPTSTHDLNGAEYLCWGPPGCNTAGSGWMGDLKIDPFNSGRVMYTTGQGIWGSTNANSDTPSQIVWKFIDNGLEETVVSDMVSSTNGAFFSEVWDLGGFRNSNLNQASTTGMFQNPIYNKNDNLDFAGLNPLIVARVSNDGQGASSVDSGRTWKPFTNKPVNIKTGAKPSSDASIAVSSDGKTIIWSPVGIAAGYTRDYGLTWYPCTGFPSSATIVSDRVNPNIFYTYSNKIYVSIDGGYSFNAKISVPGEGRIRAVFGHEGDIWITSSSGLYHSTDTGKTITKISNVTLSYNIGFGKAAPGKKYPALYIVGKVNNVYGFYRSIDKGVTWSKLNDNMHQFGWVDLISGDELVYGRVYIGTGGRGIVYGEPQYDCNGDLNGTAYYDNCDSCVAGNTDKIACKDCNGVAGGNAFIDTCGHCVSGNTGKIACTKDCSSTFDGTATIDLCGICVDGKTGTDSCSVVLDCNGVPGGKAFIDSCKKCVGGNTGKVACPACTKGAYHDSCGICVGGTTGKIPCNTNYVPINVVQHFHIYPNPTSDGFNLQVSQTSQYFISDILGKLVESGTCYDQSYIGNELKEGFYIIVIKNANESLTLKLIKK